MPRQPHNRPPALAAMLDVYREGTCEDYVPNQVLA